MIKIADLLDRDFSRPMEEFVQIDNGDPVTVFTELTEYIATDRIEAAYESLFAAMAAAANLPSESNGVWISGISGSGKSSFAKNLGYVLANRDVLGAPASSLFLKQIRSQQSAESVEFLNRAVPYEIFVLNVPLLPSAQSGAEQIAEAMYRVLLRDLDYAEDRDLSVDQGRSSGRLSVKEFVSKSFDLCGVRRPGKAFAFIVDEMDRYLAFDEERLESLRAVVEQFGKESVERLKAGKIPGPVWIIVTAQETLPEIYNRLALGRTGLPEPRGPFGHRVHLPAADIREVAIRRVLRKIESQESILRRLFRERGASLMQSVKLERSSRLTEFDEDQFVRCYPYLPHLLDLSLDILTGIRRQPNASRYLGSSNRTFVKQCFEMLVSDRIRLADQPLGALVSIDKIYDLVEGNIPWEKQKDILDIRHRFDNDVDYPGIASRVAKAICLMELAGTDLPRTTKNIAALLVQRVTEAPPTRAAAAILDRLEDAQFVRQTEDGWKLYDFDELRRAAATLERVRKEVGILNPRNPGLHNNLIQRAKRLLARSLNWYVRPLNEFNATVSRSLEEMVSVLDRISRNAVALDRLSMNVATLDRRDNPDDSAPQLLDHLSRSIEGLNRLSMDVVALEGRLAQLERKSTTLNRSTHEQPGARVIRHESGGDRTAYVLGLFGTGRWYINELMLANIGERAKYFRDTIRLHPGPTPMIYSGHSTMKYVSRLQYPPEVTSRIVESVRSGFADSIFVYRHPLDSLLTNWIWWRTRIRENRIIGGISQLYGGTDGLCADLDANFLDFKAFAEGDPDFFAGVPGPPFLSFSEFVEESELHVQAATLTLRLEDFMADPRKEFSKIAAVMSVDLDLDRLSLAPPKTKPSGYLTAREKVPRFRDLIAGLDALTKSRIEKLGYTLEA